MDINSGRARFEGDEFDEDEIEWDEETGEEALETEPEFEDERDPAVDEDYEDDGLRPDLM